MRDVDRANNVCHTSGSVGQNVTTPSEDTDIAKKDITSIFARHVRAHYTCFNSGPMFIIETIFISVILYSLSPFPSLLSPQSSFLSPHFYPHSHLSSVISQLSSRLSPIIPSLLPFLSFPFLSFPFLSFPFLSFSRFLFFSCSLSLVLSPSLFLCLSLPPFLPLSLYPSIPLSVSALDQFQDKLYSQFSRTR